MKKQNLSEKGNANLQGNDSITYLIDIQAIDQKKRFPKQYAKESTYMLGQTVC